MRTSGARLLLSLALTAALAASAAAATLQTQTLAAWEKYVRHTEKRIAGEIGSGAQVGAPDGVKIVRLHATDETGKRIEAHDGLIHHWKGSILIPGVTLEQVLKFVQDYNSHHKYFREVQKSRLLSRNGDTFQIFYRLKRTKVITVEYNTLHTVTYRRLAANAVTAKSMAMRIAELDDAGKPSETEKPPGEDSGFLWRLNSYWRYEERDGGVQVDCESISLSRDIPFGLAWLIRGYVESVPRESLTATLTSLRNGVTEPSRPAG